jgi:hypothetical protein
LDEAHRLKKQLYLTDLTKPNYPQSNLSFTAIAKARVHLALAKLKQIKRQNSFSFFAIMGDLLDSQKAVTASK